MVESIEERELVRAQFGRQVGTAVAQWALENPEQTVDGKREGTESHISVLFVDINGFTAYSEAHSPSEVVHMLNEFFQKVDDIATLHGGWINKFEGDAALIVFGAPHAQADQALQALSTAADLAKATPADPGMPGVGIGVATGVALAGLVGSQDRYEYTVIGDVVNTASRVSDVAKVRGVAAIATADSILDAFGDEHTARRSGWCHVGELTLRGKATPVEVFEFHSPSSGAATTASSCRPRGQ